MGSRRRSVLALTACAAVGLAALGVGGAFAQQDDEEAPSAAGGTPDALVERLGDLEGQLPAEIVPTGVSVNEDGTWGNLDGDAAGLRALLDTLEPELRSLFIDADDANGEVADAITTVARGWLDIWQGADELAAADSHDLAFPLDTSTSGGVATGADELRGAVEAGIELILQGQSRLLDGYTALRETGPAEPAVQSGFDVRAAAAEDFDSDVRPALHALLGLSSTSVWVAVERFDTDAPGVEPRATSVEVVCIDREVLAEAGGVVTTDNVAELVALTPQRPDCPDFPGSSDD